MGRRFGAEDVVQSVLLSFCVAVRKGAIDLERSGDLWAWLVRITFHKLGNRLDYHLAAMRSVRKEEDPLSWVDSGEGPASAFLSKEPAIEELVELLDEIEHLFGPSDAPLRRVIDLRLQNLSKSEIADRLGVSHTTVNRHLKKIGTLLKERCESLSR
jgi:RNA polymerase sigma factor (sigma-70 family)